MFQWLYQYLPPATAWIAGINAIIGGVIAAAVKFAFDFYLSESIKRRWRTIDAKRKYSVQIIRAADELASRLSNLNKQLASGQATNWLRPITESELRNVPFNRYYLSSALYLICRLVVWIEILKREQIFLDFASSKETRQFNCHLELIYSVLSYSALTRTQAEREPGNHWIYLHLLEGIGESFFIKDAESKELRCLTYKEFSRRYRLASPDSDFKRWLGEVEKLVVSLSRDEEDKRWNRLQMLWISLDLFLDFADPDKLRTTRGRTHSSQVAKAHRGAVVKQAAYFGLTMQPN